MTDTKIDYFEMFRSLVNRMTALTRQRDEIGAEITKLKELMLATFPLIPADKQNVFQKEIEEIEAEIGNLTEAIRLVFSAHKGEWLTPPQVRDFLNEMGYDLTKYRANPLASIGTTLRRMVPPLETKTEEGQTFYRRKITLLEQMAGEHPLRELAKRPNRRTATAALKRIESERK
ncbi:MAG TPA: hypothetical protein VEH30_18680 [Terriglobales bacterium]|nr:hypothetical protein [Terriglobales bacterium]